MTVYTKQRSIISYTNGTHVHARTHARTSRIKEVALLCVGDPHLQPTRTHTHTQMHTHTCSHAHGLARISVKSTQREHVVALLPHCYRAPNQWLDSFATNHHLLTRRLQAPTLSTLSVHDEPLDLTTMKTDRPGDLLRVKNSHLPPFVHIHLASLLSYLLARGRCELIQFQSLCFNGCFCQSNTRTDF